MTAKFYRGAALFFVTMVFISQILTGEHSYVDAEYNIIAFLCIVAAEIVDSKENKK